MDRSQLISSMRPLSYGFNGHDSGMPYPHEAAYFAHYGIDLENHLPDVQHWLGYVDSAGYRIACHLYAQSESKGSVFLLHGYYDHTGLFAHVIRFFLQQGYSVLAYDLPGHGLSSGKSATIADFDRYRQVLEDVMDYCQTVLPKPWLAYGQSTGCAIITDLLSHRTSLAMPMPFVQVILSAPLVRPRLWHLSRIQLYLLRPFLQQIPRRFTDNSRDEQFLKRVHNDPLAPMVLPTQWVSALDRWVRRIESVTWQIPLSPLILQGTADATVDGPYNVRVLERLYHNPETLWLTGARHQLANELEETRMFYMEWLAQKLMT